MNLLPSTGRVGSQQQVCTRMRCHRRRVGPPIKVLTVLSQPLNPRHTGPVKQDFAPPKPTDRVINRRILPSQQSFLEAASSIRRLINIISSSFAFAIATSIMSPNGAHGDATVGSDAPRQKGRATPDTIKYAMCRASKWQD